MVNVKVNRFKRDLGRRQQLGLFLTLGSPALTEMFAQIGFDWLMLDTEHSPNEAGDIVMQLQVMACLPAEAVVRPAWSDMVQVKRWLDFGVQTLLFPCIQTVEEAALAVSYTRYPPKGVRGASGASRAAAYGLAKNYFATAEQEICVLVQIETLEGLARLEQIASVDGVDGVLLGPADLAASMGHLGQTQHPAVQAAIDEGFERLKALGKPAGYVTGNEPDAARRVAQGIDFIGVANDVNIIARGGSFTVGCRGWTVGASARARKQAELHSHRDRASVTCVAIGGR
jgi:4-hydroxy-2-oxoheptanedioate aldolase